eukprot:Gregarina_sp_Poly_1__178@NODE_1040_length_5272_cov_13_452065_g720_i0_p6_GENE_NODE_1040_length_5272_cov_13_452065_g720_i0NODE_1040_length_5272_cov_13_452065_g720_i0_p6_ORF_typecomplete_len106_score8_23_NODE_1040_length_5272_cov_13_452065_g720_i014171734
MTKETLAYIQRWILASFPPQNLSKVVDVLEATHGALIEEHNWFSHWKFRFHKKGNDLMNQVYSYWGRDSSRDPNAILIHGLTHRETVVAILEPFIAYGILTYLLA